MKKISLIILIFAALSVPVFFVLASTVQGSIDSIDKYAWATKIGWINFGCDYCNVQITDSTITGYAWSNNYGWINLNPATSGVKNNAEGVLSGKAWGENLGWIDFSGVIINSMGEFTGTATGDFIGTINFSCTDTGCPVVTDWRPLNARTAGAGGSGAGQEPGKEEPAAAATDKFKILINDGSLQTNNPSVKITLDILDAGQDIAQVEISEDPNFKGAAPEAYENAKTFVLSDGDGKKIVYAKFIGKDGQEFPLVFSSIILKTTLFLSVDQLKNGYKLDENVIISGKSDPGAEIIVFWDKKYGIIYADNNGEWIANIGKIASGVNPITITAKDSLGNSKKITIEAKTWDLLPVSPVEPPAENDENAIDNIGEKIWSGISSLMPKIKAPEEEPNEIIIIPEEAPEVLKNKWNLLPVKVPSLTK